MCPKRLGMEDEKRQEVASKKASQKKTKTEAYPMISTTHQGRCQRKNSAQNLNAEKV